MRHVKRGLLIAAAWFASIYLGDWMIRIRYGGPWISDDVIGFTLIAAVIIGFVFGVVVSVRESRHA